MRAYDSLQAEQERVRAACMKILAQNDRGLQRELLRAKPDDAKRHDEMRLYEERLSGPQRRRLVELNRYRRKIERLLVVLLKL